MKNLKFVALILIVLCAACLVSCEEKVECLVAFVDFFNGTTYTKVLKGNKVAKPNPDPTYEGATFVGWYADEARTVPFNFDSPITGNTDIYAKWDVHTHKVYVSWEGVEGATAADKYVISLRYLVAGVWKFNTAFIETVDGTVNEYTYEIKDMDWKDLKLGLLVTYSNSDETKMAVGSTKEENAVQFVCDDMTIPKVTLTVKEK